MAKRIFRSVFTFLGIVALFPLGYILYNMFLQSDLYYSFHGVGDGMVSITTWLDINANGVQDEGEPPLPDVCAGYADSPENLVRLLNYPCESSDLTDAQGRGGSGFLPGWSGKIYEFAIPPEGYQPTTDMVASEPDAKFGFVQKGMYVSRKVETTDDFARLTIITTWMRRIAIGFFIFMIAGAGTIWLEKQFK